MATKKLCRDSAASSNAPSGGAELKMRLQITCFDWHAVNLILNKTIVMFAVYHVCAASCILRRGASVEPVGGKKVINDQII